MGCSTSKQRQLSYKEQPPAKTELEVEINAEQKQQKSNMASEVQAITVVQGAKSNLIIPIENSLSAQGGFTVVVSSRMEAKLSNSIQVQQLQVSRELKYYPKERYFIKRREYMKKNGMEVKGLQDFYNMPAPRLKQINQSSIFQRRRITKITSLISTQQLSSFKTPVTEVKY